ncbi:class I SAM-dependent methyltransferase [Mesorhizobium xinjiangense]|uniref:class I SAM-dependent methyltransferase n=1 Tax=Mesorhizobium xinjiangense TaxID=2678685 RepID=UPI0012ED35AE|nr:class I SAM-dependent methyltransferase [Mesorhizobium xinjiangense]
MHLFGVEFSDGVCGLGIRTTKGMPVIQHRNPFEGLNHREIYDGLMTGQFGPLWPDEKLQAGYTAMSGPGLVKRAFDFIEMLDKDGAFKPGWRGLDYGCGWGRFASTLLSKGLPEQLDLCDAWPHTLSILANGRFTNKVTKVPEILSIGDIPTGAYDFILSFSVFTHLNPTSFERNIPVLVTALKPGGTFYFTVRRDEFIDHNFKGREADLHQVLNDRGILFTSSDGVLDADKVFGHAVVTDAYLKRYGARYVGQPHSLQHVYAITRS